MTKSVASFAVRKLLLATQLTIQLATAVVPVALLFVSSSVLADWPFVRGPHYDGHSEEIDIAGIWPEQGPPVLWTRALGQGYSAFVASGDRVYTQGQNMTGQYVYCLEADTGITIWEYRYDWPYEAAGVYPGPRSTPTLANKRVYFTSPDGLIACLDQNDGTVVWSVDLQEQYGIRGCDFGYACSPTVIDNTVILPVGGENAGVVALSADTGTEIWTSTSDPASYTPAYPIDVGGTACVVCYMHNSLLVLNRQSGRLLHREKLSSGYDEHSAWPIYREPYLWLSGPFRAGSYVLNLSALGGTAPGEPTVQTVWRSKLMSNDVCSSVCVDGFIYGFDIFDVQSKTHRPSRGIFRCLNLETGEETWSVGTGHPRRNSNSDEFKHDIGQSGIIVADGKLIVLNELGELILLNVDPTQCDELARCTILGGELTWTPPCLHRGRLYVRNQSRAVCIYLGKSDSVIRSAAGTVADLPQRQYHNLAARILAVEPEYAFDVPHDRWLLEWFLAGSGIIAFSQVVTCRSKSKITPPNPTHPRQFLFTVVAGAIGTTILGRLTGEFIFTWPVCLYASLEFVIRSSLRDQPDNTGSFIGKRIPLLVFLCVSITYFLVCRRLSLVFEWAFLIGFVSALPVVWIMHRVLRVSERSMIVQLTASIIGFASFFAGAVGFLKSRY